eukprot:GFUD01034765.1.p1 GENE.GFUD01034765.1~~GFUD01034765.1.p1  ORF type:complete len:109 (+),score=26.91 GFUD01034765.1:135-461(+)
MGSEQSTETGKTRVTETANFDFRYEPSSREMGGRVFNTNMEQDKGSSRSRGWLEDQKSFNTCGGWKNKESTNIYSWQDNKSRGRFEEGMDAVKKIEKEDKTMNIYTRS